MELLKRLYKIHSKSGREKNIKKFIKRWVLENVPEASIYYDKIGNVYITKGESATYPVVVAHLDQVQNNHSRDFQALEVGGIIIGYSEKSRSQQGLGADDKNGIWVALKCLLSFDVLKVAFFVSEEIGCVGSEAADMTFFSDARFVLQCDRRGAHDLITVAGWSKLCNGAFVEAIKPQLFGYKEEQGMLTDVLTLKENGLGVCCVNISCGYYEPHTDYEHTNIYDLMNCLSFVEHIISTCTDVYPHQHEGYYSGYYDKYYDDYYENVNIETYKGKLPAIQDTPSTTSTSFREIYYDVIKEILESYPTASFDEVFWYLKESHKDTYFWEDWTRQLYYDVKLDIVSKHQREDSQSEEDKALMLSDI